MLQLCLPPLLMLFSCTLLNAAIGDAFAVPPLGASGTVNMTGALEKPFEKSQSELSTVKQPALEHDKITGHFTLLSGNGVSLELIENLLLSLVDEIEQRTGRPVNSAKPVDLLLLTDFDGVLFNATKWKKIDVWFALMLKRLKQRGLMIGGLTQRDFICSQHDLPLFTKYFGGFNLLPGLVETFNRSGKTAFAQGVFYARAFAGKRLDGIKSHALSIIFKRLAQQGRQVTADTQLVFIDDLLERNLMPVGKLCVEQGLKQSYMIHYQAPEQFQLRKEHTGQANLSIRRVYPFAKPVSNSTAIDGSVAAKPSSTLCLQPATKPTVDGVAKQPKLIQPGQTPSEETTVAA